MSIRIIIQHEILNTYMLITLYALSECTPAKLFNYLRPNFPVRQILKGVFNKIV